MVPSSTNYIRKLCVGLGTDNFENLPKCLICNQCWKQVHYIFICLDFHWECSEVWLCFILLNYELWIYITFLFFSVPTLISIVLANDVNNKKTHFWVSFQWARNRYMLRIINLMNIYSYSLIFRFQNKLRNFWDGLRSPATCTDQ